METSQAAASLAALSQESRLRAFRLLVRAGPDGLSVGAIASSLGVPPATLSFHLKELTHAGLVRAKRDGRSVIYSPDVGGIRELMSFLTEDCCQGHPELCAVDGPLECGDGQCG